MEENQYVCTGCNNLFNFEDGRFAYPAGDKCNQCGDVINELLKSAEKAIEAYRLLTGYDGVKIDHGY